MRAVLAILLFAALASPARAEPEADLRAAAIKWQKATADAVADKTRYQYPVVELVTMGVGSLIWERHGHIALCVVYEPTPRGQPTDCYNYGIADFQHALSMTAGFFRQTNSFWVGKMDPLDMLWTYVGRDRTVWVQPLPLTPPQARQVIDKLESDIQEQHKYYAYDHFWDNCTTRVRDVIDKATGGALASMNEPTDGRTYRQLAREGFFGIDNSRGALLITDIAMGRVTDRVPSYFERMFLPDYLREAVEKRFHVAPVEIYTRKGPPPEHDGPSGRWLFAFVILLMTSPVWATRLWGRFQRTGLVVSILPYVLLGAVLWFLAIISPLPYVRWNETCLVLLPTDLALAFLRPDRKRAYARARVAMLGLIAALMLVGVIRQPLWSPLLWPLVPNAVVGFWRRDS